MARLRSTSGNGTLFLVSFFYCTVSSQRTKALLSLEIINLHVNMKDALRARTPDQTNYSLFLTYESPVATTQLLCISIILDDTQNKS